jgi:peptidoglycan/xylan/chitin deacetylase (PgdA/CDA1 family)
VSSAGFRRLARSAVRVARTRYPTFLFGGGVPDGEIPVFTYHDVGADVLRGDLEYLEINGYRTLSLDEFGERSAAASVRSDRCVLLTFDDARRSFWDTAYPVLREHSARAAVFVPSYWIAGGRAEDGEGAGAAAAARADAAADPGFMTWQQLAECAASGGIDVESHAHRHTLVATSARLVGFASPAMLAQYDLFDWPMRREDGADVPGRPAPGTPIYESQPMLSARTRMLESSTAARACRRVVEQQGPAEFFVRRDADAALRAAHAYAIARGGGVTPMSAAELERDVAAELALAVESFERELGRRPRYFAYPWMLGTRRSVELLAELGIEAAFGVALDFRQARRGRGPLRIFGRYKCDWLRFLPGRGRQRLYRVLPRKMTGFRKSQHLAH